MMPLESSQPPNLKIEVTYTALILSLVLYMYESSWLNEMEHCLRVFEKKCWGEYLNLAYRKYQEMQNNA